MKERDSLDVLRICQFSFDGWLELSFYAFRLECQRMAMFWNQILQRLSASKTADVTLNVSDNEDGYLR